MLEMVNISKSFFGVQALRNVTLKASPGKVLALIGINGAGKTTLMNILGGNVKNDSGKIVLDGKEIIINNPQDAEKSGIAFIHQEPLFFLSLTVAENIFVTNLVNSNIPCFIGMKKMISMSEKYLNILGSDQIDPMSKMENISIGERQIVEIARSFVFGAKIIIFDEPTSSLSQNEKKSLFEVIDKMKAEGKIIIYISHLLDEIKEICDEYLVLRDGNMAGSGSIADVEKSDLTRMIVGKDIGISQKPLKQNQTDKKVILSVKNFQRSNVLYDISFDLIQGEILGIWGLMGSGRTELVRALLGFDKLDAGEVYLFYKDKLQKIENSKLLRYCGYVTEDRHTDGLFFGMNITRNNTSASLSKYTYRFFQFMNTKKEERDAEKYIHELNIKTPGTSTNIENLSGGNQQKVIFSKWINKNAPIFILDEPTRGVDVGAKLELGKTIQKITREGASVILISSEIEEIVDLSDRVLVMRKGKLVSVAAGDDINNTKLMWLAMGEK